MSGSASYTVNTSKRPVVKMTAINFIGPSTSTATKIDEKITPQVSNFDNFGDQNDNEFDQEQSNFSFHHPHQQQPSQGKFPTNGKKPALTNQLETSPYMTQQKAINSNARIENF